MLKVQCQIIFWLVLTWTHGTAGNCALEIGITPAFRACLMDYTAFQAKISEEGLLLQGSITPMLCSDESKKAIKCMMEYYFQCPDVISNAANSRKLLKEFETTCLPECTTDFGSSSNFRVNIEKYKILEKQIAVAPEHGHTGMCSDENIQTMVSLAYYLYECPTLQMYIGGSNTAQELSKRLFSECSPETDLPAPKPKTCPSAFRCVLLLFSNYVQVFFAEHRTPYRKLQKQIGFFCGKTGNAFKECLRESMPEYGSCEVTVPNSRSTLNRVFSMSDARNESVNGFLERECSAFPDDFADSTCISQRLESEGFVHCLDDLDTRIKPSDGNASCQYYESSLRCLQHHVTGVCGHQYLPAFQRAMAIFLADMADLECSTFTFVTPASGPSSTALSLHFQWTTLCVFLVNYLI